MPVAAEGERRRQWAIATQRACFAPASAPLATPSHAYSRGRYRGRPSQLSEGLSLRRRRPKKRRRVSQQPPQKRGEPRHRVARFAERTRWLGERFQGETRSWRDHQVAEHDRDRAKTAGTDAQPPPPPHGFSIGRVWLRHCRFGLPRSQPSARLNSVGTMDRRPPNSPRPMACVDLTAAFPARMTQKPSPKRPPQKAKRSHWRR